MNNQSEVLSQLYSNFLNIYYDCGLRKGIIDIIDIDNCIEHFLMEKCNAQYLPLF